MTSSTEGIELFLKILPPLMMFNILLTVINISMAIRIFEIIGRENEI